MLGKVTPRTKLLIGAALLCAGWIIMMPDTSQTIEPVRGPAADAGEPGELRDEVLDCRAQHLRSVAVRCGHPGRSRVRFGRAGSPAGVELVLGLRLPHTHGRRGVGLGLRLRALRLQAGEAEAAQELRLHLLRLRLDGGGGGTKCLVHSGEDEVGERLGI